MAVAQSQHPVGREEELDRVRAFFDGRDRATTRLLLEGEAGIGKTTLWNAGLEEASRCGGVLLEARPAAAEQELSFAALGDLLVDLDEEVRSLPAPQRRALRIALVHDSPRGEPPEQRTIAVAVTELLRRLSRDATLVIALDDMHWLDAPSAAILDFALRRLDGEATRVFATARMGEDQRLSFAAEERLTVGPLSLAAIDALMRERLDARFLRPVLHQLQVASRGNPFYALELASALLRSGRRLEPGERLPVPTHLRTVAGSRLATLTRAARDAALATAALAQPTVALVAAAMRGETSGVAEAVSAGVLEREGEVVRFTHPLFASSIYEETARTDRKAMHKRLAEVVTDPEERARHLAEGADGPDAKVASFVEAAAGSVAARGAADAAARLSKLAVDLTPAGRASALHKRRLDCARYSLAAGDPAHAETLLEQQLQDATPGRERAEVHFLLGRVRRETEGFNAPRACYERALAELDENDELELQAMILVELAGIPEVPSEISGRAVALAEWLERPDLLARALGVHGMNLALEGRPPPEDFWQRALELEQATGELRYDGPTSLYAFTAFILGDDKAASEYGERLFASMRARGDPMLASVLLDASEAARVSGDWDAAERYADEAHVLAVQTGRDMLEPQCLLYKARVALPRGDLDEARRCAEEALALVQRLPRTDFLRLVNEATAHSTLAQIAEMEGAPREAAGLFSAAIEEAGQLGRPMEHMLAELIASHIECLLALERVDDASKLLERLLAMTEELGFSTLEALLSRTRGLLAAAAGDRTEAFRELERAVESFQALPQPWPFQVARALLALGTVQRRDRQKLPARRTLEQALEIFDRLGARLWAERTRAELDRVSGRPSRPGALTPIESRVAQVVASGRSNAEAAHELFMSPKTVEWNLSKIYRKLHVRSRAELAAKLANGPAMPHS